MRNQFRRSYKAKQKQEMRKLDSPKTAGNCTAQGKVKLWGLFTRPAFAANFSRVADWSSNHFTLISARITRYQRVPLGGATRALRHRGHSRREYFRTALSATLQRPAATSSRRGQSSKLSHSVLP